LRLPAAVLIALAASGCASTGAGVHEVQESVQVSVDVSLDIARELALGTLQGAGRGALTGLRIVGESRCDRRECLAILPVTTGVGAVVGGLAGGISGVHKVLARRSEPPS
jgi:hypothetical protein